MNDKNNHLFLFMMNSVPETYDEVNKPVNKVLYYQIGFCMNKG